MSYYRRLSEHESIARIQAIGNSHEYASTHWLHSSQTPRVYWNNLRSYPWWNPDSFKVASVLKEMFSSQSRQIQEELNQIIHLQNGQMRDIRSPDIEDIVRMDVASNEEYSSKGFKKIFTPYIGVRSNKQAKDGWSEYGPLFNGVTWNTEKCRNIPTLCSTLQKSIVKNEICGLDSIDADDNSIDPEHKRRLVEDRCGSDTIVTILKLQPGTHILPHCGTTNKRLILHQVLRGKLIELLNCLLMLLFANVCCFL